MGWIRAIGAVAVLAGLWAAPAAAQNPGYGGGRLPSAAVPKARYVPTVGIALQPRGDRMALRFDTSLRCGRTSYDVVGRALGRVRRARLLGLRGAPVADPGREDRLRLDARRRRPTGPTRPAPCGSPARASPAAAAPRCDRKPTRAFAARVAAPAPGGAPRPPAGAAFGGLSTIRVADGLRGPVVLKATSSGRRIAARWTAFASCRRGPRADLVNFTPSMRVRADGSFSRSERFAVRYVDALVRYRVRFAGRVSGEGATGRLRMRARDLLAAPAAG